jgi:hypothetical protein
MIDEEILMKCGFVSENYVLNDVEMMMMMNKMQKMLLVLDQRYNLQCVEEDYEYESIVHVRSKNKNSFPDDILFMISYIEISLKFIE